MHWDDVCPIGWTTRKSLAWCLIALHCWAFHLTSCHDTLQVSTAASVWVFFTLDGIGSPRGPVRKHNTYVPESYVTNTGTDWLQIQTLPAVSTTDNCDCNFNCQYHDHYETMVQGKYFEGKHSLW